jgi:hypothetical protein
MAFIFKEETAPNIDELKRMAATKSDANLRLQAVEELGKWKSRQSIDILWRLMINDLVYEVQHASFLRLQAFGEDVKLPRKAKGNLIKQIDKKVEKVLKAINGQVTFEEFVEAFQKKLPEEFDVYKHEKKNNFEKWLKNIVTGFPTEVRTKIKTE